MRRAVVIALSLLALVAASTDAHQSPAGCTANRLALDLTKSVLQVRNGQALEYRVHVANTARASTSPARASGARPV
jgi:hypothetical protein